MAIYSLQCVKLLRVSHSHQQFHCAVWNLASFVVRYDATATEAFVQTYAHKTGVSQFSTTI